MGHIIGRGRYARETYPGADGGAAGAIGGKVLDIEVPFTTTATATSAASLPTGAKVVRAVVVVTTTFSPGATVEVGDAGNPARYQLPSDNNPQAAAGSQFDVDAIVTVPAALPVVVTIGGMPAAGSGFAIVFYTQPLF